MVQPRGGDNLHTSTPTVTLNCGGIVPGQWRLRAELGLGVWEELGSSAQPCPEAMAVLRVGVDMGMWVEKQNLPSQGSPSDHPHTLTPDSDCGFFALGRSARLELRCWSQVLLGYNLGSPLS